MRIVPLVDPPTRPPRPAASAPHPLSELIALLGPSARVTGPDPAQVAVTGATHDSHAVRPGDLYAALPGARVHGAEFVPDAVAAGAVAVLTDPAGERAALAGGRPVIVVWEPRTVLGRAAGWAFGTPAGGLRLIGVTGTNGKTTTAYLAEAGLRAAGLRTGLVGTVETRIAGVGLPSVRTTPEATDLQALLALMRERAVDAAVMEVSSHALALHRIDGVRVDVAVFMNLSQDHLDFHGSMADYFDAKARLFTPDLARAGVVVVDDDWGRRLAASAAVPLCTVSTVPGTHADWRGELLDAGPTGTRLRVTGPDGLDTVLRIRLPGAFNAPNAVAALAALVEVGVPPERALAGIGGLDSVPGRMEPVDAGQPFLVLVDYAHTPEAVQRLLAAVRPLTAGRLILVLGCGGDRDQAKRPLMAANAVAADLAVFTTDNPRSEDPAAILAEMLAGVPNADRARVQVEPDRRTAIAAAVGAAGPGDTVVVAGKGHETGQEVAGVIVPFDDRLVLAGELTARWGRRPRHRRPPHRQEGSVA